MNNKKYNLIIGVLIVLIIVVIIYMINPFNNSITSKAEKLLVGEYTLIKNTSYPEDFNKCNSGSIVEKYNDNILVNLSCDNYENKNLIGDYNYFINKNELFLDPETGNDLSNLINYNTDRIQYIYKDTDKERMISVTDNKNKNLDNSNSTRYPIITLNGESILNINLFSDYNELGSNAYNPSDNSKISNIKVIGNVDTNKIGTYKINYCAKGNYNNYTCITRTINVIKNESNLNVGFYYDKENYEKEKTISIKVEGVGLKEIVLPDNTICKNMECSFSVKENGNYKFIIKDLNNDIDEKDIVIDKIDNTIPTGTCTNKISFKKMDFDINYNDDSGIKKYTYYVNDKEKESNTNKYSFSGSYKIGSKYTTKVKLEDLAGNTNIIDCTIKNSLVSKTVKDTLGYDCLEGHVCYKQKDYPNTKYQATSSGVHNLATSGCLPTSMTIISTYFDKRSKNGNLYTPPTLVNELIYKDGKVWGYSNYERVKYITKELNLKVSEAYHKGDTEILKEALRSGKQIVFNMTGGCYSTGAHYLTIIGINEKDEIFISDPYSKTQKSMTGKCIVNAWSTIDEWKSKGGVTYFAIIEE